MVSHSEAGERRCKQEKAMFSVVTKCDFVSEFPFIWQACLANRKTHPN
jgi:hypothetical protein